jgi:hypothetical protein
MKLLGTISVDFNVRNQLLIRFSEFVRYWKNVGVQVHQLFVDVKKAYASVRRAVLYNILIEFGIPMKLVRLVKMKHVISQQIHISISQKLMCPIQFQFH